MGLGFRDLGEGIGFRVKGRARRLLVLVIRKQVHKDFIRPHQVSLGFCSV